MWSVLLVGLGLLPAHGVHPSFALESALEPMAIVIDKSTEQAIEQAIEQTNAERSPLALTARATRVTANCPTTLDDLIPKLLRDLPSYSNRVIQRSRDRNRTVDIPPSYVLLAGQSDQEPLPLGSGDYGLISASEPIQQVFFTTLERQYGFSGPVQFQGYYWMFLTRSPEAWQLVNLRTSLGDYPSRLPPSPPRDSNDGVVAQAIRLWLRDCHAGAIRSEQ